MCIVLGVLCPKQEIKRRKDYDSASPVGEPAGPEHSVVGRSSRLRGSGRRYVGASQVCVRPEFQTGGQWREHHDAGGAGHSTDQASGAPRPAGAAPQPGPDSGSTGRQVPAGAQAADLRGRRPDPDQVVAPRPRTKDVQGSGQPDSLPVHGCHHVAGLTATDTSRPRIIRFGECSAGLFYLKHIVSFGILFI